MAILHFENFDNYAVVAQSAALEGANAPVPIQAAGWTGNGATSTTPAHWQIVRVPTEIDPEPRLWLSTTAGRTPTSTTATFTTGSVFRRDLPVQPTGKMVVGFKMLEASRGGFQTGSIRWFLGRVTCGRKLVEVHLTPNTGNISICTNAVDDQALNLVTSRMISTNPPAGFTFPSTWDNNATNTIEVEIDDVNATASVWVNNIFVGTVSCPDSQNSTTVDGYGSPAAVWFARASTSGSSQAAIFCFADLYIVDGSGERNNSRLGRVKVLSRLPTADVQAEFTRPPEADSNAEVVSQIPPSPSNYLTGVNDGDTDIYSSTAFDFSNEAILATGVTVSGFRTDPAGNDIAPVLSISGTEYELDQLELPVGQAYSTQTVISEVNPATGLPYTKSALDSSNFGIRVKAVQ